MERNGVTQIFTAPRPQRLKKLFKKSSILPDVEEKASDNNEKSICLNCSHTQRSSLMSVRVCAVATSSRKGIINGCSSREITYTIIENYRVKFDFAPTIE
jgi:hypothetical protein